MEHAGAQQQVGLQRVRSWSPSSRSAQAPRAGCGGTRLCAIAFAVSWCVWGLFAGWAVGQATTAPATRAGGVHVAVIKIEGLVRDSTFASMQRRLGRALEGGATLIVFELDTPDGMVSSALGIAAYIKADVPVPTVAWINKSTYSAGILIASACDQIVMAPGSATGDCAPMVPNASMPPIERAKALSPLLEEFRDNARSNGYDYVLFHAMCVLGVEVYLVEHKETGQRRLVNQADYRVMVGGEELPKTGSDTGATAPGLFSPWPEVATDADRGSWIQIKQVHNGKTLLTVNQDVAVELGLAQSGGVQTDADLRRYLNATTLTRIAEPSSVVRVVLALAAWLGLVLVLTAVVLVIARRRAGGRAGSGG